jgi:hypothetical protein
MLIGQLDVKEREGARTIQYPVEGDREDTEVEIMLLCWPHQGCGHESVIGLLGQCDKHRKYRI